MRVASKASEYPLAKNQICFACHSHGIASKARAATHGKFDFGFLGYSQTLFHKKISFALYICSAENSTSATLKAKIFYLILPLI